VRRVEVDAVCLAVVGVVGGRVGVSGGTCVEARVIERGRATQLQVAQLDHAAEVGAQVVGAGWICCRLTAGSVVVRGAVVWQSGELFEWQEGRWVGEGGGLGGGGRVRE